VGCGGAEKGSCGSHIEYKAVEAVDVMERHRGCIKIEN
jgi:hypothetical protein